MSYVRRHIRFHGAFLCGMLAALLAFGLPLSDRMLIGVDLFFVGYLISTAVWAHGREGRDLRDHFAEADEGSLLITLMTLGAVGTSLFAIIHTLVSANQAQAFVLRPILALAAVPLGWATVHTVMAFHYAGLYYANDLKSGAGTQDSGGLEFPGECDEPGPLEFMYYSFTLGMTAQTSDIGLTTTAMRRDTLIHAVVCYFYNTVIVALAVNAGMSLGQGG